MTSPEQGSEHRLERNLAGVFQRWWNRLNDVAKDGAGKDRPALARLRRITMTRDDTPDVLAALNEPAFRQLCSEVDRVWGLHELADDRVERLLTAAVTLAHIKQDAPGQSTAGLLGGKDDPDRAMKEGPVSYIAAIDKGSLLITLLLSFALLGEPVTGKLLLGAGLITSGLVVLAWK